MRHISIMSITVMLFLASCTETKMKRFAEDFAMAVQNDDTTAIAKIYPGAEVAEQIDVNVIKDSLSVEECADTFIVNLDGKSSISIIKADENGLRIVDSHGLFSYPKERMDFALKTGWIKPEMSDMKIAEQFADTLFTEYLAKKYIGRLKSQLTVRVNEGSDYYLNHWITAKILNESEFEIKGRDYEVTVSFGVQRKTFSGKDIKPSQTQVFTLKVAPAECKGKADVKFLISDADILARYFIPEGNEYEHYLHSPLVKRK